MADPVPRGGYASRVPYEREFARWIPGNPFDALLAVFVFMPEDDS